MRSSRDPFSKLLPLFLLVAGLSPAADTGRTVILVRHADRAGEGISPVGQCAAEALARMLADSGVKEIFTSEAPRTQQTAKPTAEKLAIAPQVIPSEDTAALVKKLRLGQGTALVVGHSNTVPEIVTKLGGGPVTAIAEKEFDRLLVMKIGSKSVLTLRYPDCTK